MSGVTRFYRKGEYNFCCDLCGEIYKSGDARFEWDGLITCPTCLEMRHPQELIRAPRPERPIPWSRNCGAPGGGCTTPQSTTRVLDSKLNDRISTD